MRATKTCNSLDTATLPYLMVGKRSGAIYMILSKDEPGFVKTVVVCEGSSDGPSLGILSKKHTNFLEPYPGKVELSNL